MKLDVSVNIKTIGLAYAARYDPWYSGAVTNERHGDVHGHVRAPLRDMGLSEWGGWSRNDQQDHLKGAWGAGDGT